MIVTDKKIPGTAVDLFVDRALHAFAESREDQTQALAAFSRCFLPGSPVIASVCWLDNPFVTSLPNPIQINGS